MKSGNQMSTTDWFLLLGDVARYRWHNAEHHETEFTFS